MQEKDMPLEELLSMYGYNENENENENEEEAEEGGEEEDAEDTPDDVGFFNSLAICSQLI